MYTSTLMSVVLASLAVASPIAKRAYVIDWTVKTVDITITAGQPTPTPYASIPQIPSPAPAPAANAPAEFFEVAPAPSQSSSVEAAAVPSPSAAASSAPAPSPSSSASSGGVINGVDSGSLLTKHNDYRSQHSASPLTWDQSLSDSAQQHAAQCIWQHSTSDERSAGNYGQNMFASTEQDASAIGTTVDSWYSEYTQYPFSNPPQTMAEAWGHFSQLVWKGTSTVGCANYYCDTLNDPSGNAMAGLHSFIVCNYQNPGNYDGEFAQNVS